MPSQSPSNAAPSKTSMSDAHEFRSPASSHPVDRAALADYLAGHGLHLDEDPIRQFATGLANINYRLSINGSPAVLRRPPDGDLPPGAHDMRREHRILSRLHEALPLAPRSIHLCEDPKPLGVPFQIIEYRPGLVIKGSNAPAQLSDARTCAALADMMIETLAAVHAVDVAAVGLADFGRPEGFIDRTKKGWLSRAQRLEPAASTAALAAEIGQWLAGQTTISRHPTLLHSDFKLDNLILDPVSFSPRAIVDWDMGTRGDPLFDVATLLSYWTEPGDPECMQRLGQMPTTQRGFPTRNDIVAHYGQLSGLDISDYPVLRVLAMYKLAVVFLQLFALYGRGPDARAEYKDFDRLGEELFVFTRDVAQGRAD